MFGVLVPKYTGWNKSYCFHFLRKAHSRAEKIRERKGRVGNALQQTPPGMTRSHLVWLSLSPAGEEGPPLHSTIWYLSLQQSYISSSFFLRNKTPFLVLIVCCSELSNWYNCGQSRYCICVCVRVRYVWILRKAAWYFIFKLWLLLHSPTYNGFTPEGWILFWYQFSKKNKAMQANTTKRTGAKFSPKDFLSLVKKQETTERLSHQCHSNFLLLCYYELQNIVQTPVPTVLFEISPFLFIYLFLFLAGILPIFPSWGTDPYVDQYLLIGFYYKIEGQNGNLFLLTWKQNLQWIFKVLEAKGDRTRLG